MERHKAIRYEYSEIDLLRSFLPQTAGLKVNNITALLLKVNGSSSMQEDGAPQGQGYGHPGGFAPPQGPPQGQYAPPQQQGYAPPPQQYQQHQPQQSYGAPPPQQNYGAPPPQQNFSPRTYLGAFLHPSSNPMLPPNEKAPPGQSVDGYNPDRDVEQIHKACKGFGTDEAKVIASVAPLSAAAVPVLCHAYRARHGVDLVPLLKKELGGRLEDIILSIMRGPLEGDLHYLREAMNGAGTNEVNSLPLHHASRAILTQTRQTLLTELLIGRPPSSLQLLRTAFGARLDSAVEGELSFKTKRAFAVAMMGDWRDTPGGDLASGPSGGPVNEGFVMQDYEQLKHAMSGVNDDEILVASIVFARSPNHLQRLQQVYKAHTHKSLTHKVKANFTGHLQNALLFALEGGKKDNVGAWRDAKRIHKAMDGMGTDDKMLIARIVRGHWDRQHWTMVRQAYQVKYKVSMAHRVSKETSGDFEEQREDLARIKLTKTWGIDAETAAFYASPSQGDACGQMRMLTVQENWDVLWFRIRQGGAPHIEVRETSPPGAHPITQPSAQNELRAADVERRLTRLEDLAIKTDRRLEDIVTRLNGLIIERGKYDALMIILEEFIKAKRSQRSAGEGTVVKALD
ncbi:hypothetical protein P7C70_g6028, partial [Phenoliferia sp. Uapishka_3]